ncbi:MAG: DMT family transporter [Bacillota bacterium]|uniref:DMT family transporter n=1 Tax=Virgibacillus TaxID=84406 RepID=UPI0003FE043C|nr:MULTISPECIES: multidrug efflux SMR transporter [Bacillaceae]MCC2248790.1 multidrug efflux SMR transporter [Virgibacillus sp. AGTR]MDY7045736.1 multidrug efflux SMR transporter [Virgibacillus sp. M23]QRZ17921.1 multidrug efflux SMR transporter [Virgibacillus sp. AGTR]
MNKNWIIILVAGLFEIGWVIGLKHSYNLFTWLLTVFAIYISMHLLIIASRKLPIGTSYAVFTGIGTAGTVIAEIVLFDEPFRMIKIVFIMVLLIGVLGLKMVTTTDEREEV